MYIPKYVTIFWLLNVVDTKAVSYEAVLDTYRNDLPMGGNIRAGYSSISIVADTELVNWMFASRIPRTEKYLIELVHTATCWQTSFAISRNRDNGSKN